LHFSILIKTDAYTHTFLYSWLNDCKQRVDSNVIINDVTGSYASFELVGPNVNDLLSEIATPPFNKELHNLTGNKV